MIGEVVEFKPREPKKLLTVELLCCPECNSTEFNLGKFEGVTQIQCAHCNLLALPEDVDWLMDGIEGVDYEL